MDTSRLICLHGLARTRNSGKSRIFREWFPDILIPNSQQEVKMMNLINLILGSALLLAGRKIFLLFVGTGAIIFMILFLMGVIAQGSVLRSEHHS